MNPKQAAPTPPDPQATSAAQTGTSVATAIANQKLNNVNQVGPAGSTTFTNSGTTSFTDPYTHQTYQIPQTTETTSLSPAQQAIYDQSNSAKLGLATAANGLAGQIPTTAFNGSDQATEARLMQLGQQRLDPLWNQRQSQFDANEADKGIKTGSQAYTNDSQVFNASKNDAYNNLILSGNDQAFNQALTTYNNPANDISALLSGSQVQQPNTPAPSQSQIPTTDVAGNINSSYNDALQSYNIQNQNNQGLVGGLFGLGAGLLKNPTALATMFSDRRVKTDIIQLAKTTSGYFKYAFHYIWDAADAPYRLGYMAQEVREFVPKAVFEIDGILALDYSMLEAV